MRWRETKFFMYFFVMLLDLQLLRDSKEDGAGG